MATVTVPGGKGPQGWATSDWIDAWWGYWPRNADPSGLCAAGPGGIRGGSDGGTDVAGDPGGGPAPVPDGTLGRTLCTTGGTPSLLAITNHLEGWFSRFKIQVCLTRGLKTQVGGLNFVRLMARHGPRRERSRAVIRGGTSQFNELQTALYHHQEGSAGPVSVEWSESSG